MLDLYYPINLRCDDPEQIYLSIVDLKFKCKMKSLFIIQNQDAFYT